MARSPLPELLPDEARQLLVLARDAVIATVRKHALPDVSGLLHGRLAEYQACFVTLHQGNHLRGCIGSLEPYRPLAEDVCANAVAAATRDPRFTPVRDTELPELTLTISVLTPAEPMNVSSEAMLLTRLRPGIDGLILDDGYHRATFLPEVWSQLPQATDFVRQLKRKAGLPDDYWSPDLKASTYQSQHLGPVHFV